MEISPEGQTILLLQQLVIATERLARAFEEMALNLKPRPRGRPRKDATMEAATTPRLEQERMEPTANAHHPGITGHKGRGHDTTSIRNPENPDRQIGGRIQGD